MVIRTRGLDFIYDIDGKITDVNVRFDSISTDGSNIGGFIKITKVEYDANQNLEDLANVVLVKLKEKVNA